MRIEVSKLLWKDIGIWDKVEIVLAMPLLHLHYVLAQVVLSSDLIAGGEVVDLLVLIQSLIEIGFAAAIAPKDIPLVRLRVIEVI